MKHIVMIGLGNPGPKYQTSRHNAGFLLLDQFIISDTHWAKKVKPDREEVDMIIEPIGISSEPLESKVKLHLIKPLSFMNKSGLVAAKTKRQHPQLPLTNWYVAHDDLDLPLGQYKIQFGRGPKEHNGLLSIYDQLGTSEFWHVRIGVDGRGGDRSQNASDYVLQSFPPDERATIDRMLITIKQDLKEKVCYD